MYLNKQIKIYSSRAINYEIDNISDGNKKRQVEDLYDALDRKIKNIEKLKVILKNHFHYQVKKSS